MRPTATKLGIGTKSRSLSAMAARTGRTGTGLHLSRHVKVDWLNWHDWVVKFPFDDDVQAPLFEVDAPPHLLDSMAAVWILLQSYPAN